MTYKNEMIDAIRRPKILVRAAKIGLEWYRRERDLGKVIHSLTTPTPERAVERLVAAERELEQFRATGQAGYDVHRHIAVLTALLGEARLLPKKPDCTA
jgi:hypothetical protein